jgi:hypothetical protein
VLYCVDITAYQVIINTENVLYLLNIYHYRPGKHSSDIFEIDTFLSKTLCFVPSALIRTIIEKLSSLNSISTVMPFSSPEPFSLGHSLKIRLWVRRLKGEI